jgi:hypothetical protein
MIEIIYNKMTIDWTQIILAMIGLLSSGSLATLAVLKYTKRKAKIEAKSDDNKEQSERIDLGDKYVTQMLTMIEKLQDAQDKYMHSNALDNSERKLTLDAINSKVFEIHNDLVGVKDEVTNIVQYLNGDYQNYLRKNEIK